MFEKKKFYNKDFLKVEWNLENKWEIQKIITEL